MAELRPERETARPPPADELAKDDDPALARFEEPVGPLAEVPEVGLDPLEEALELGDPLERPSLERRGVELELEVVGEQLEGQRQPLALL